jgi:hypothetical protein
VRGVVVADDRDAHVRRIQAAQVAAQLQELGALLAGLDVPEQSVAGQVVDGEQVPDAVVAVVGGAAARALFPVGVLVLAADRGPVPAGCGIRFSGPNWSRQKSTVGSSSSGITSPSAIAYRCSTRAFLTA